MARYEEKTIEQLNEEANIAADYLEGLLDVVEYDGDIELGVRNGRPNVQIVNDEDAEGSDGEDAEADSDIRNLIGKNGEVVDALQLLTRLAVQQKTGERSQLILDVDGYLKKRRKHLRDIALDAVDEVQESGEPQDLEPMNSFERKVVHDLIREEGLKSRSHGEEPHRYVTVYLKQSENTESGDGEFDDDSDLVDGVSDGNDEVAEGSDEHQAAVTEVDEVATDDVGDAYDDDNSGDDSEDAEAENE